MSSFSDTSVVDRSLPSVIGIRNVSIVAVKNIKKRSIEWHREKRVKYFFYTKILTANK
jgi:hypothetical protein